ncbi:DUF3251 domain-containing protein [Nissabacter archeti]|uniref:DUF3251 domain-containing protein n=1 Tax=Nissabacter archeti TaxID=1917880 RepID=A0ABS5JE65_9GAMM|nr:DUF3251 domain-containing protein [Nissabacter archeti]
MTTSYPVRARPLCRIALLASAVLLTACAQNPQVPKLKSEVVQLNQKLQALTDEATALEQQSQLNHNSTNGVYVLPAANNPAALKSAVGELSVSLSHVAPEASGTQALLHIRALSGTSLPAFTATVDWGQLDPTTGKPLLVDMLSQPVTVSPSLLPKTEQTLELRFSGQAPEQLGFIRLRDVTPTASSPTATPEAAAPEATPPAP